MRRRHWYLPRPVHPRRARPVQPAAPQETTPRPASDLKVRQGAPSALGSASAGPPPPRSAGPARRAAGNDTSPCARLIRCAKVRRRHWDLASAGPPPSRSVGPARRASGNDTSSCARLKGAPRCAVGTGICLGRSTPAALGRSPAAPQETTPRPASDLKVRQGAPSALGSASAGPPPPRSAGPARRAAGNNTSPCARLIRCAKVRRRHWDLASAGPPPPRSVGPARRASGNDTSSCARLKGAPRCAVGTGICLGRSTPAALGRSPAAPQETTPRPL